MREAMGACRGGAGARASATTARARWSSSSTTRRALLLPGDEHAHPGRTPGHRDGHRHRPGGRADCAWLPGCRCPSRRRSCGTTAMPSNAASMPRTPRATSCRARAWWRAGRRREGEGMRCDTHCHDGYIVTPYYDSLLGQADRARRRRARWPSNACARRCSRLQVQGPATTASFHHGRARRTPTSTAGRVTTRWVEDRVHARAQGGQQPQPLSTPKEIDDEAAATPPPLAAILLAGATLAQSALETHRTHQLRHRRRARAARWTCMRAPSRTRWRRCKLGQRPDHRGREQGRRRRRAGDAAARSRCTATRTIWAPSTPAPSPAR